MSRCVQTILTGILTRNHSGSLSTTEWRDLILVARANSLLPRVASILLSDVENDFHIPPKAHAHLVASIRHETLFHIWPPRQGECSSDFVLRVRALAVPPQRTLVRSFSEKKTRNS